MTQTISDVFDLPRPEDIRAMGFVIKLGDAAPRPEERRVKCMLFADVKDFSKLREEHSPRFFGTFLKEVAGVLQSLKHPPTL